MAEPGSDEWFAEQREERKTKFFCRLRTRETLPVLSTAEAVVERVLGDAVISNLIELQWCIGVSFRQKPRHFDQRSDFTALLPRLAKEPRAIISGCNQLNTFSWSLSLNCDNVLVEEKVAGKRRQVPEKASSCQVEFDFSGVSYCGADFLEPFLRLVGDCFGIIGGDYGWVRNLWLDIWTDSYDQRYGDWFAPEFLTWANLFGPRHVEAIGRDRFHSARAHSCVDLPGGGLLLTMCADPRDFTSPKVQKTVKRVKKHLGILSPSERATPQELAVFEAEMHAEVPPAASPFAEAFRQADEQTPGEMARQAAGAVDGVKQFWNLTLDYTRASVVVIDQLILTTFPADEEEDSTDVAVQAFGAYLGECVRRNYGGTWCDEDMKGQPVLHDVGSMQQHIDPFAAVRQRFENRPNGVPLQEWWESIRK